MKQSTDIIKWGRIKPYFDKSYDFNSIDIETVDNELFILGFTHNNNYYYYLDDFYNQFHEFLLVCARNKKDVLTWSRYDNTHLVKLIFSIVDDEKTLEKYLLRIGKISPIFEYQYKTFTFIIKNIIKDSIIFEIRDQYGGKRSVILYNLKNLYVTDLETTAKNYQIDYYDKLGEEYHIIDKDRFDYDPKYRRMVLYSNELDNRVLIDIANNFLKNFKSVTGVYPKTIFTAGSIARSYLLARRDEIDVSILNFHSMYKGIYHFNDFLDYTMRAYHGGKIESYVLGYVGTAKIIDISSAYPYALSLLPKITKNVVKIFNYKLDDALKKYFYLYLKCDVYIDDPEFIHPLIVKSPINISNLSPYGYIKDIVITKPEYEYLIENGVKVNVKDGFAIEHVEGVYPYKNLVDFLFESRLKNEDNPSLADLFKTIINSLYGITFELNDIYEETDNGDIEWLGFRAGDFFNPAIASYITAIIRTYLSKVSYNIIKNGGEVYLNMTDSIIYNGDVTLDVFSDVKTLGKFDPPEEIEKVIILGAGRYEYRDVLNKKYTIKSRGFSVSIKDKSFYSDFDLNNEFVIPNRVFVSTFRSTTNKYSYKQLGHLIDDVYVFNPFNLGGKRYIKDSDKNIDINKSFVKTHPIYLDKDLYIEKGLD